MQLGELRLWSEPGPFAALVAVIRGDPPEGLHDAMRNTLSRIHAERHHALESFNGDSSGLGDVEARLRELVALGAHERPRTSVARVIVLGSLLFLLILAGGMDGVVVVQPAALGGLSGAVAGATRNRGHRSGQA